MKAAQYTRAVEGCRQVPGPDGSGRAGQYTERLGHSHRYVGGDSRYREPEGRNSRYVGGDSR